MKFLLSKKHAVLQLLLVLMFVLQNVTVALALGEGSDLEIGGYGSEAGKFNQLRDMAFDGQNNLYTLEGFFEDPVTRVVSGNGRIQKFDAQGNFVSQISLRNDAMGVNALGV